MVAGLVVAALGWRWALGAGGGGAGAGGPRRSAGWALGGCRAQPATAAAHTTPHHTTPHHRHTPPHAAAPPPTPQVSIFRYDNEEWNALLRNDGSGWSREETDYLFDLCEQFQLRFVVMADRYDFQGASRCAAAAALRRRCGSRERRGEGAGGVLGWGGVGGPIGEGRRLERAPGPPPVEPAFVTTGAAACLCRSVEDLKERYYSICRKLLVRRRAAPGLRPPAWAPLFPPACLAAEPLARRAAADSSGGSPQPLTRLRSPCPHLLLAAGTLHAHQAPQLTRPRPPALPQVAREGGEAAVANQLLVKYPYNAAHERQRKRAFHTLLTRCGAAAVVRCCGVVWCGVVWCGVVWCGVVWCGVVWLARWGGGHWGWG